MLRLKFNFNMNNLSTHNIQPDINIKREFSKQNMYTKTKLDNEWGKGEDLRLGDHDQQSFGVNLTFLP